MRLQRLPMAMAIAIIIIVSLIISVSKAEGQNRPNILIIMADDMGFDDISFRGRNEFLTPNIDALAYSGVILNNLYVGAMSTSSRAALLTGKYPINTGMQHSDLANSQPWSLPLNETLMPQIFQKHGYYTSLIGKWHLGMSRKAYTPTMRGFDQHYGFLGSHIDYYDQTAEQMNLNFSRGHDFRNNLQSLHHLNGSYVTDLLTQAAVRRIEDHNFQQMPLFMLLSHLAPHAANGQGLLQAPPAMIEQFTYIKDPQRRIYAAMMSKLDDSVGEVVQALSARGVLNNTMLLFLSDNGGPTQGIYGNTASNYPLRGQKNTPWEGGLRSSAAIWSMHLEQRGTIWQQKIYIADIFPTLAAAANIPLDLEALKIDGLNLWSALNNGYDSVEREIMHNIDDLIPYEVYSKGKWKFINGSTQSGSFDSWLGYRPLNASLVNDARSQNYDEIIKNTTVWRSLHAVTGAKPVQLLNQRHSASIKCEFEGTGLECKPLEAPCLFDLDADPCEQNNLYEKFRNSTIVRDILERIAYFRAHAHEPNNKPADALSDPANYHNEWTWWEDVLEQGDTQAKDMATAMSFSISGFLLLAAITVFFLLLGA